MPEITPVKPFSAVDAVSNRRRGGEIRVVLSPNTVGATSGFMGVLTLRPEEFVSEHYHPYSEEFIYLVRGSLTVRLHGGLSAVRLTAGDGVVVPIGVKHRVRNDGPDEAFAVFHLCPLAPRPEMGHVDTEPYPTQRPLAPVAGEGDD